MRLRQEIGKVLPSLVRNRINAFRNTKRKKQDLSAFQLIDSQPCDTTHLRPIPKCSLQELFTSEGPAKMWMASEPLLRQFKLPDGTGGVNPGDRRAIFYLICALRPGAVLEIGTHIGASTIHIAAALQQNEKAYGIRPELTSLDIRNVNCEATKPWQQYGSGMAPNSMVREMKAGNFVHFETGESLPFLRDSGRKFDFIFLDGDHSASTVYKEIPLALKSLKPDGVILLHDYFPREKPLWIDGSVLYGPYRAVERHIEEGADFTVLPLGELPWETKFNSHTTSLALLLRKQPA